MKREAGEVNGSRARRASFLVACVASCLALAACGGAERRAERLWRQALDHVAAGQTSAAVTTMQKILDEYPDTEVATRARKQIVLYRGLESAVQSYPIRRAREVMILVSRAIEAYRAAERRLPESLEQLVPTRISALPRDPWDRSLEYETTPKGYRLRCDGSDGVPGGVGDAADLLVVNGEFATAAP